MSYRPITDVWILGRPKVRYYGAYPSGFLERALRERLEPFYRSAAVEEILTRKAL